ncbi:LVIVD repeat-containing protein [Oceanisphaera sp. KMM 10153]|uniref:LVIVD repeat-containing protein n=1 Tax=Oceanisphaera submarina TaxID=3390193 RepID=UPI0039758B0B
MNTINKPQRNKKAFSKKHLASAIILTFSASFTVHAETAKDNISDPFVKRLVSLSGNNTPHHPSPGSYGMNKEAGTFTHPAATPHSHENVAFDGQLTEWDTQSYINNMTVEAYYPITVEPFHTWQNIVDFDGRRYLYQYVRRDLKIFDITNPKDVKLLLTKGKTWGPDGGGKEVNPYDSDDMFGAASIQWNENLGKYIMVQAFEIRRFGVLRDKYNEPEKVEAIRNSPHLKGFKVYEMDGPLPEDWTLIATRTTDIDNPDAPVSEQQGSGVRDIPTYFGGDVMFVAAASSDKQALTEYPNDLYSAGYQAWDMSDPYNPRLLDELTVPGQMAGDPEHEAAYKNNPRAGNRTSWMGARMSLFVPTPGEQGGKYGYAAMGGLGFYVVDISDPSQMNVVSHLAFPPSLAGTEGDNIDVSQVEKTGLIYYSGYPLAEDCYEAYKDVHIIDVNNPLRPEIKGVLPRPTPPAEAGFTDYCQRKGSFGPKRTGYYTQPGTSREGILPYAFYNAGVQIFDISNPDSPRIGTYFVPPFKPDEVASYAMGNLTHGVYVEYDRNLVWLFTNHGFYALSTPLLGEPSFDAPEISWPSKRRLETAKH